MKTEFDNWWNKDSLIEDNPYGEGTAAFWAWEGWVAGVNAEREACAKVCETLWFIDAPNEFAAELRARGNK